MHLIAQRVGDPGNERDKSVSQRPIYKAALEATGPVVTCKDRSNQPSVLSGNWRVNLDS